MNLKIDIQRKSDAVADVNVEIPQEELKTGYNKELNRFRQSYKMPGFRPGKVPVELIEKQYKAYLENEAAQKIISNAYYQALHDNKLVPYSEPKFNKFDIDFSKTLTFTATLELSPTVDKLGEYKEFAIEKDTIKIEKKDIENTISKLQNDFAELLTKDEPIAIGDVVVIDGEGFQNDEPLKDTKLQNYKVEVSSEFLPEDFVKGLVGLKKDDEKDIIVKYPKDYFNSNLVGQKIKFKIKVKDVMTKKLPELNDEFAKDVGPFETFEVLKKDIEEQIEEEARKRENALLDDKILEKILENSEFSIPKSLVKQQVEKKIKELEQQLRKNNITLEQYYNTEKTNKEEVEKKLEDNVLKELKSQLVLLKIAELEKIQVEQQETDDEIKKYANETHLPEQQIRDYFLKNKNNYLETEILVKKTLKFLRDSIIPKKGKVIKFSEYK